MRTVLEKRGEVEEKWALQSVRDKADEASRAAGPVRGSITAVLLLLCFTRLRGSDNGTGIGCRWWLSE